MSRAPVASLAEGIRAGHPVAVARALSMVENAESGCDALLAELHAQVGRARRIGVTGPPGAGKSTLTDRLTRHYRDVGFRVAVLAVDPSSPISGGALLGDRIRMEGTAMDDGVFIRSMAARGSLGGLALTTGELADVLDVAGYDRILIETVGVGQSELDIVSLADLTILVVVPESGDSIQVLKSGIMEVADCFVVNKADRPGADLLRRELEVMIRMRREAGSSEPATPPVVETSAHTGLGIDRLADLLDAQWDRMAGSELVARRQDRRRVRARAVLRRVLSAWAWRHANAEARLASAEEALAAGTLSPHAIGEALRKELQGEV